MKKLLAVASFLVLGSCAQMAPLLSNPVKVGKKVGESCATFALFSLHLGGDNYIHTAAKKGKIRVVSSVNRKQSGFFPLFYKSCTVVSGK